MESFDIESQRLTFKRVASEHISEDYVSWINDPEVNRYLETRGNYTLDLLKSYIEEQNTKASYFWAIHLKGSNKHIGNIKIDPINFEIKSGEYGILIGDKSNWRKGYASEATIRIIKYCFEELGLTKITLGVVEDNVSAVNLYKKLGFQIDEIVQGTKTYNNKISNSLRMSIHV